MRQDSKKLFEFDPKDLNTVKLHFKYAETGSYSYVQIVVVTNNSTKLKCFFLTIKYIFLLKVDKNLYKKPEKTQNNQNCHLVNEIKTTFKNQKFTSGVFVELCSSFDTVDHKFLTVKA